MNGHHRILVITGPTASGKTDVAIRCARELGAHILGADSRQVYSGLRIGTARPLEAEMGGVPHHLIGILDPSEPCSAGRYADMARDVIADLQSRSIPVIVCGGSGLYISALVNGIFEEDPVPPHIREDLAATLAERGAAALLAELEERDPATAARIDRANMRRVLRALEICRATGRPYSQVRTEHFIHPPFESHLAGILWPRDVLYARINARVDRMLDEGLLDEVRTLLASGISEDLNAMQTVGYKEAVRHLHGTCPYDEMREAISRHTRNFAKRQLTWFRNQLDVRWHEVTSEPDLADVHQRILTDYRLSLDASA